MSKYGDKEERFIWPTYDKLGGSGALKSHISKIADKNNGNNHSAGSDKNSDTKSTNDNDNDDGDDSDESDTQDSELQYKTWLQVLPSRGGLVLAALLAEIMTDGLTPDQMNILGNFVSSVGSLISYKASRDET